MVKHTQTDDGSHPAQAGPTLSAAGLARRRFTRAGAAATGVILTLQSQPGMACDVCASPSGSLSGVHSHTVGPAPVCLGRSPSYWAKYSGWPSPCKSGNTFGKIFPVSGKKTTSYNTCTQMAILGHQSFDSDNVGMYLMAAYLNAQMGWTSFIKPAAVLAIWNEWQSTGANSGGYYTPTAGTRWNSVQIVTYLSGTMDN